MKLAHVTVNFPPHIGGIGEVCFGEAHGLSERGHDVTVFSLRHGPESRSTTPLSQVKTVFLSPLLHGGDAGLVPQLLSALKGFDLVHLHYPFYGGAEWVYARSLFANSPYIVTYHMDAQPPLAWKRSVQRWYDRFLSPRIMNRAERVIAVDSKFFATTDLGKCISPDKVVELANAIDVDTFYPRAPDWGMVDLEGWENKKILLFVGNLLAIKRVDLIISALPGLPPDVVLAVVGGGVAQAQYEALAQRLGVEDRVRFVGPCFNQKKISYYYSLAHAVVVPSDYESFSLVTVEAQATGAVVVASAIPSITHKISPGIDGFLFAPGSVESLQEELRKALSLSRDERRSFAQRARGRVVERYGLAYHLDELERVYGEVLAEMRNR